MRRRLALQQLGIMLGGTALVPHFLMGGKLRPIMLENLSWKDKEPLAAALANTILPKTDIPGATDLGVHLFVLKMVEDCYQEEDQHRFLRGLELLDELAFQRFGKSFSKCAAKDQSSLVQTIEDKSDIPDDLLHCYVLFKQRTIQGFMSSEYIMTQHGKYEVAPGRYNGYQLVS